MRVIDPINEVIGNRKIGAECIKHPELGGLRNKWRKCLGCVRERDRARHITYQKTPEEKAWRAERNKAPATANKIKFNNRVRQSNLSRYATLDYGEFDHLLIIETYDIARRRGWVVDHVIPLKGKLVCGLHVGINLQAVPHHVNASKSNKFVV